MSTRFDILATKATYETHVNAHRGCKLGCAERKRLFDAYMNTAARWGIEPGDDDRQRRQYNEMAGSATISLPR